MAGGPPLERAEERWLNFAVQVKSDGRWIGRVQATVRAEWAEVAYLFVPASWGRGFASESLAWLNRFLASHHDVSDFWATSAAANQKSIGLLLRAGYRRVSSSDAPRLGSFEPGDIVFRFANAWSDNH